MTAVSPISRRVLSDSSFAAYYSIQLLVCLACSVISGVDPIAHVRTSRDPANDMSNLSVGINLGVVVNMAIYVSQVLEHLEAVGGEDFESALVAV